ncbi:MAG TPA: DNA replication and repair protein RecF [Saprospiraceae bacterium]|nr:DNA replication and repair protein RecF [Saprospiraceae bacterium]HMP25183.1 DNA replication and repair protein RecF [Saprospiraceae bacterium]
MHLTQLKLTNFKNYVWQEIACSPQINCFLGLNGMGKTNLLDAVYYACMTRSHTGVTDVHVVRHGADFFRIEAHFQIEGKSEKVVAKVIPRKSKVFECNELVYNKLSDHIGAFPVVMIAPGDTEMVTDGSEVRRRFLDNTLSQIDRSYLNALLLYNKVLQQRNAALKQFAEQRQFNAGLLEVYNAQLIAPGTLIADKRRAFADTFGEVLQQVYATISGGHEVVDSQYESKLNDRPLAALLAEATEKDRLLQRTTVGIHRDDLALTLDGRSVKQFASQGQLKSLVLALKLAQYEMLRREKNMRPLLLLDDIFDKLDKNRVQQLLELLLQQSFGQIFITDTDEQRVREILSKLDTPFHLYHVEAGVATLAHTA